MKTTPTMAPKMIPGWPERAPWSGQVVGEGPTVGWVQLGPW